MARKGTFRLPSLQRLFKWRASHVRDLFDSIYRGFPIGTLLLWKAPAQAGHLQLGPSESPVDIDAEEQTDALWIVDGQQRISSLVGVLSPSGTPAGVFKLYFDLAWEEDAPGGQRAQTPFVSAGADRRASPGQVLLPMDVVLDSEQLDAWLDEFGVRNGPTEHVRRARRLNKLIREYKIPAYVVETENQQTLVLIFERINNAGERLLRSEVFNAQFRSANEGYGLFEMGRRVQDLGFGDMKQDDLMKVVVAVNEGDITFLSAERFRKISENPEAMRVAEVALCKAVDFIRRDVDIPHEALLPYVFPVIVLAKFFRFYPSPVPRSRALLARWVWRGAITGEHRAEHIPEVRAILRDLKEANDRGGEEAAVQMLMNTVPHEHRPAAPRPFRFNSAQSKLELLALTSLGPRNLVDGELTGVGPLFASYSGRVAPLNVGPLLAEHGARAVLTMLAGEDDSDAPERTLANLLIHPPISRRLLMAALASATPEALMSHGIDSEAADALRAHDYKRMIELRGQRLSVYVASFLDAHARWGETDRPSLAWLTRRTHEGESEGRDEDDARA